MSQSEHGMFFEVAGQLMKRFEGSFNDKRDKEKQVKFYRATIGWVGGKFEVPLTKEAFEDLPPDGSIISVEGTLAEYDGKLKPKGLSVESSGPSLDSVARRPGAAKAA